MGLLKRVITNKRSFHSYLDVSEAVREALFSKKPVVALESTIVTHGMPYPANETTALDVQNIVRQQGVVPATIGVVNGRIKVGMTEEEIHELSRTETRKVKISRRDFPFVLSNSLNGGTTVAGTLMIAKRVGISIFVTGGIGGVHRDVNDTMDISADLLELSRSPVCVVCSGVKSILDIGRTLEFLETCGVCVVSYGQTKDFPAFYTRTSGFQSAYNAEDPRTAANLVFHLLEFKSQSGILLGVPVPEEYSFEDDVMQSAINEALVAAKKKNITGKAITPFLLEYISRITGGKSLESNIALIKNNALIGSQIAVELNEKRNTLERTRIVGSITSENDHSRTTNTSNKSMQPNIVVVGGSMMDIVVQTDEDIESVHKPRKFRIHDMVAAREKEGDFKILFPHLLSDPKKFFNYFRMSVKTFYELLDAIRTSIAKEDTDKRTFITAEEKLAVTLRYLATGCSMTDLHYSYRLSASTIRYIIRGVCKSLWNCLREECLPRPSKERWLTIAKGFKENSNFPNCIGAVDGKYFRVIKPRMSGSDPVCSNTISMLAVCDSNYCFTYVEVGTYEKGDSSVFAESNFCQELHAQRLDIPEPTYISQEKDFRVPFVLVGDEAFELTTSVMRPYGGKFLPLEERVFNYRLTRARRFIERTFCLLKNKWRVFHGPLNVDVQSANDIIRAGVVLHNFVRVRDGCRREDLLNYTGLVHDVTPTNPTPANVRYISRTPVHIRDYLTKYFESNEGLLPWQYTKV